MHFNGLSVKKGFLPVLCILTLLAPSHARPQAMESLQWLSGCWSSDGGESGSGEFWTPLAGDTLFGVSRTVRDGRTVAHEFLQIRPLPDGSIGLIAQPSGQAETTFRLVSAEGREAVFENPDHDFPQRVVYRREGDRRLSAWIEGEISGQSRRVDFPMSRTNCDAAGAGR
jgi:hypothetical protein